MKFTINAETIQELIKTHVSALIEIKDGVELDVEYDDEGNADVSLVLATATKPAPKKRGPKPKAAKKPEPVKEEVQEELPLEEESDVGNVCSIVSKYFDDALVESGLLPDDDYHHIPTYTHSFGSVDPENPRCEITIIPIEEEQ